ncbi:hypothetical protein ACIA59_24665 [Micromonospora haikouensis]|uniref:hypothetical protein n=1 Tax=Micromonospora haikouensis TaxID=686309 RepID=UPI003799F696
MFPFHAGTATPWRPTGIMDGVLQATVDDVLNDAGVARYPTRDIEAGLRRDGILMRGHLPAAAGTPT